MKNTWPKFSTLLPRMSIINYENFLSFTLYKGCVINKCRTDAVILDLVESKKLSIAALRFIFLRKDQFKRTSLNRTLLFSCPLGMLL